MPTAKNHITTTLGGASRRSLLRMGAATLTAGAAVTIGQSEFVKPPPLLWRGGPRPTPSPDAPLLALAASFLQDQAVIDAWNHKEGDEDTEEDEAALERTLTRQNATMDRITETPEVTLASICAKARCAIHALESLDDFDEQPNVQLAHSALSDLVRQAL